MTDGDSAPAYYLVDFDAKCIYLFYADESDDTCYVLPIEEGNLNSGLKGNISDGYSMIPFTMRFKEENRTDRVIMTMEDAYDVELVAADFEKALAIKESKTIVELGQEDKSGEDDEREIYTAEGQISHRDRIVGKEEAEKIVSGEEAIDMLGPSSWTSDEVIAQNYAKDKASGDADSLYVYVHEIQE